MYFEDLFLSEDEMIIEDFLNESAVMRWGKSGDKIVKKYRCTSGPKTGRLVSTPAQCGARVDPIKRLAMKKLMARMGKRIARKAKRTKRTNPVSKQVARKNAPLNEANILGTSIYLKGLPEKYRKMPLIGKGSTSLVFQESDDTVIMLTVDRMKADWFNHSDIGQYIESFPNRHHPHREFADMDVYVYRLPFLHPLDTKNKRIAKAIAKKTDEIRMKLRMYERDSGRRWGEYMNALTEMVDEYFADEESLQEFMSFIQNYDERQFNFDFLTRNFMQDSDGKIIAVDPIVSKDVMQAFQDISRQKHGRMGRW